jgi:fructose-1,6-bisphosphatase I
MEQGATLEAVLRSEARASGDTALAEAAAATIVAMAGAAIALADLMAEPRLAGRLGAATETANSDGDRQRKLDLVAEDLFSSALRGAPVACYLSEEVEGAMLFNAAGSLAVAIDPLDGSSNIDVNAPVGTIFSILPTVAEAVNNPALAFGQTGRAQIAAGFFIYGPQTSLMISMGAGVNLFVLSRQTGSFILTERGLVIPQGMAEYAINASNHRHWREPVRRYIEDCIQGAEGPHGSNFNMRWVGSMVADAYRIFMRGGVFLYPADDRKGYEQGRLRLMYEANPLAFLAEQAGGGATDGRDPVLDRKPGALHERAPLVMGSLDKVERVRGYHRDLEAPPAGRLGQARG